MREREREREREATKIFKRKGTKLNTDSYY